MFHMVGPVGLYRIRCSVKENRENRENSDYITLDQMEHHDRWLINR